MQPVRFAAARSFSILAVLQLTAHNFSEDDAALQVASAVGIPHRFDLLMTGEDVTRPCRVTWQSNDRLGICFIASEKVEESNSPKTAENQTSDLLRNQTLALRAALDEVTYGVVLLDHELRARLGTAIEHCRGSDLGKALEDHVDRLRLAFVDDELAVFHIVAERHEATHPHALLAGGRDLVPDTLADNLALELGE